MSVANRLTSNRIP